MNEREVQFHAALLECGNVPNIKYALMFDGMMCTAVQRREAMHNLEKHKVELLKHLARADYFEMYYSVNNSWNKDSRDQLTEKAALWVGEFYQWMLTEQSRVT